MAKFKLTQSELAALDALIAEMKGDNKTVEADIPGFITVVTPVTRVTLQITKTAVRVTPNIITVTEILGKDFQDEAHKELGKFAKEGLSLQKLIELRQKFN